ncbi:glycosyltransferase [Pseudomonas sp. NPDC089734]|uniref:glycosyltransferase n=1 Tax=Pseudomonas sp. NPDC089734 TaxID=3364469 RepID=UPI0038094326
MTRSLYAPRPSPYYIFAFDYRRNSAGIRVLHALCDALIRSGHEAYVRANVVHPGLMTPRLTSEIMALHREQGVEPIVVYPEVVPGNPLGGNVVVRYLLNQPGFLNAVDVDGYGDDDIFYGYTHDLQLPGQPDDQLLFMPPFDRRVFRLPEQADKRIPGKICYYQGRGSQARVDPALLAPDSIEITSTWPASWEELADVFQQCEYFYSTESSALAGEAALCGCIGVILPNEHAPKIIGQSETKGYGIAWGQSPEQLEWARQTLPMLRERMIQQEAEFWTALDGFIKVTQQAVVQYKARPDVCEVTEWLSHRVLTSVQRRLVQNRVHDKNIPILEFVITDVEGSQGKLSQTIDSIHALQGVVAADIRLRVLTRDPLVVEPHADVMVMKMEAVERVEMLNTALKESAAQWFMLLDAGEEVIPSGFLMLALELAEASDSRAFYADETMRFDNGRQSPLLRPDLNLDLLLSCPSSMTRHWWFNRQTWDAMGCFAAQYPEAFEFDYILRLIEQAGFEGVGHVSEPFITSCALNLQDSLQDRQVIERHLRSRGFEQAGVGSRLPGCYEVNYGHASQPPVSILVTVDGHLAEAQRCMESLLEHTPYNNYELLILDKGNDDPMIVNWLSGIEQLGADHLRVLRYGAEESVQAVRNHAAHESRGEFLLFLDSGIGVMSNDWLQQLLNHAMRPEVGCVGAKLLGGDGKIRDAAMLLGLGGPVGMPYRNMPADAAGYMQRLLVDQNCSALSDKCLMVRHEHFMAVGGFDEQLEPWSDVDLCLKLQQGGYLNVWTPRVQLLISDREVAPPVAAQEERMYERWLPVLARDSAYNRNFSLESGRAFRLGDTALSWRPTMSWAPLPTVLVHPVKKAACGQQRIIEPFNALRTAGLVDGTQSSSLLSVVELERYSPDAIVLQRQLEAPQLQSMQRMKQFSQAFKVYDLDSYLPGLPEFSRHKKTPELALQLMGGAFACMDRVVVSSAVLAQVFDGLHPDIRVMQTRLAPDRWSALAGERRCSSRPRIGWVGGHEQWDDLNLIADVIKTLGSEVEMVCLGACPDSLRPHFHEVHKEVTLCAYPARLASLNLDLALVPLQDTVFNRCKGNLRLLEFGACGVPVICSDLEPFQGDLPVTRVKNTFEGWMKAIRAYLGDLDSVALLGDAFRAQVQRDWMLDENAMDAWRSVWLPD